MRHGVTAHNARGLRCGGDLDLPLTATGCSQAFRLGRLIARLELAPGRIVTADLLRTRQTALIVSGVLGAIDVTVQPLLNERRLGAWNGQPVAETEPMLKAGETPPGGESETAFSARVLAALESLRPLFADRLLVVSSRGVARVAHTLFGGPGRLALGNGEVVRIDLAPGAGGVPIPTVHRLAIDG